MAHENAQLSKIEISNIKLQLADLQPTGNENWSVQHSLKLTMVDGKMINSLTDTSSAMRCTRPTFVTRPLKISTI